MYKNDPRMIQSKFKTKCAETGKIIEVGEWCVYYPTSKQVFCEDSNQAQSFREWQADIAMGNDY